MEIRDVIKFIQSDSVASEFFEDLAGREKNYRQTTVKRAQAITKAERADVVAMFKRMEELELGRFVIGRRGAKSRFEWSVSMVDAGLAATKGRGHTIAPLDDSEYEVEDEDDAEDGFVKHDFRLRDGDNGTITISLPSDLTQAEAKRVGIFVSSLPIVEGEGEEESD